ncbi:hypothetical protein [Mycolicibacterium sp. CBMA 226]|uniref:hypothetical protein n=1 Tax=Mycolicibacterium sp. CBMA 226 TaxID=2606611 RepID=UPI0012DDFBCD|nr:hypothetical protein [Mycolicibacterium sp. CBMA 226]MUL77896.1 hypothetical protein [Mycolicibacterium sp. CBMA 226]
MTGRRAQSERCALLAGWALTLSGIAHLVWPRAFESVNRMAFADHIRGHVLINGSIEAGLGLSLLNTRTRRAAAVATVGYLTYFNASLLRRQKFGSP